MTVYTLIPCLMWVHELYMGYWVSNYQALEFCNIFLYYFEQYWGPHAVSSGLLLWLFVLIWKQFLFLCWFQIFIGQYTNLTITTISNSYKKVASSSALSRSTPEYSYKNRVKIVKSFKWQLKVQKIVGDSLSTLYDDFVSHTCHGLVSEIDHIFIGTCLTTGWTPLINRVRHHLARQCFVTDAINDIPHLSKYKKNVENGVDALVFYVRCALFLVFSTSCHRKSNISK